MGKKILCFIVLLFTPAWSQMIFPENRDYFDNFQASFVDGTDNYPIDGAYGNGIIGNTIPSNRNENSISRGLNNFALNLNKILIQEQNDENVVMSPLSIAGAMTLLLLGSVGQTYNEIATSLGFFNDIMESQNVHREFAANLEKLTRKPDYHSQNQINKPYVAFGSALFLQNDFPIRQQYQEFVQNIYKSVIRHVDYKNNPIDAQQLINRWVNDLTNGRIQEMLALPPPFNTKMIITNALYFKGEWERYFMEELTKKAPFTMDKRFPQQTVTVDMMATEGMFPFYRSREHGCMIVGLPYKGNTTYMYAIKPLDATKKDIRQIISEMSADSLNFLIRNAREQSTIVTFPKMKLSSKYNLKSVLQTMGVRSVFSSLHSNLALLSPAQNVYSTLRPQEKVFQSSEEEQFIFTRLGEENNKESDCAHLFQNRSISGSSCTTVETVNNRNVTVVYKQIGDKIGRRILKRSLRNPNKFHARFARQLPANDWNPGLYVDDVLHKVDMDITETGTEAAASTAILISRGGNRPLFTGNEPFFFVIRDEETKFILFSAVIMKPTPNYT